MYGVPAKITRGIWEYLSGTIFMLLSEAEHHRAVKPLQRQIFLEAMCPTREITPEQARAHQGAEQVG